MVSDFVGQILDGHSSIVAGLAYHIGAPFQSLLNTQLVPLLDHITYVSKDHMCVAVYRGVSRCIAVYRVAARHT